MSLVEISTDSGVRTITINRPDAHNSLNSELRLALRDAFVEAARDADAEDDSQRVRAVLLRAEGKAFCSGQDLKEHLSDMKNGTGQTKVVDEYNPMTEALVSIPVPVVAAIQGPAAGAGWGIAMACDFRIMSEAASFKGAFTQVGLSADSGLSASLSAAVGPARALELLILDEKYTAKQALAEKVVTGVAIPAELEEEAHKLATRLAQGPTASYREIKQLLKNRDDVVSAAGVEAEAQERLSKTKDHLEAISAFLEKRAPEFTGR